MSGKLILIIIIGVVISTAIMNNAVNKNAPVDTVTSDFYKSLAYDIANAGANIAANKLYFSSTYEGTLYNAADFNNGKLDVSVDAIGADSAVVIAKGTFPPSGSNKQVVEISYALKKGYFDNYAVLTNVDNTIPWTTYDTAYGDIHSNNKILFSRYGSGQSSAVFTGHVTSGEGYTYENGADPDFYYTPQSGITVDLPTAIDVDGTAANNLVSLNSVDNWNMKYTFNNGSESIVTKKQLHLQFFVQSGVTKVRYFTEKRATNRGNGPVESGSNYGYYGTFNPGSTTDPVVNVPANGIIHVSGADVFVEGTVKGKVSVVCNPDGSGNGGNIIVTNDLKCNTNPVNNPASSDYIGLLANNNLLIGNTASNASHSSPYKFSIQATILALNGGLSAIDNAGRDRRILSIFGSITQGYRKGVGSGSATPGPGKTGGFAKNYSYDNRLKKEHAKCVNPTNVWGLYAFFGEKMAGVIKLK